MIQNEILLNKVLNGIYHYALSIFLDSEAPPSNFLAHSKLGVHNKLCVFCMKEERTMSIPMMHAEYKTGPKEVVNICSECNIELTNMLEQLDKIEKSITSYINSGFLPEDARNYAEGGRSSGECIFCRIDISNDKVGMRAANRRIKIPQGFYEIIHSDATCCENCMTKAENLITKFKNANLKVNLDTCNHCEEKFPVAAYLYYDRVNAGTIGEHICDDCLVSEGHQDCKRYQERACECGKEKSLVDVSHVDFVDSDHTFKCATCGEVLVAQLYIDGYNLNILKRTTPGAITYCYDIFKGWTVVKKSEKSFYTSWQATALGCMEIEKLNTQLKLEL